MKNQFDLFEEDFGFDVPEIKIDTEIGLDEDFTIKNRYFKPKTNNLIPVSKVVFNNAQEAAKNTPPYPDCRYYCIVSGDFIFGDYLEALILDYNINIKEMYISTLAYSKNNVDSLRNILEFTNLQKLNLMVSRYFYGHEIRKLIPYTYEQLDYDDRFQLAICDNHSKIAQFETHAGNKVVIYGSANLRASQNIEQFTAEENKSIYDFNKEYFDLILKEYSTINKAIGYKNLIEIIKQVETDKIFFNSDILNF